MGFRKAILECKKSKRNLVIEESERVLGRLKLKDNSIYWVGLLKNSANRWQWLNKKYAKIVVK